MRDGPPRASAGADLRQALLNLASSADTADVAIQALKLLAGAARGEDRAALRLAAERIGGRDEAAGGRPPVEDDAAALSWIRDNVSTGIPQRQAIAAAARSIGGDVERNKGRLRRKIFLGKTR